MEMLSAISVLLSFICVLALVIGVIKPSLVLRRGSQQTRGRVVVVYGLLSIAFLALGALTAPEATLELNQVPAETTEAQAVLSGRVSRGAQLWVNDKDFTSSVAGDGTFSITLPLSDGDNRFTVVARHPGNASSTSRHEVVIRRILPQVPLAIEGDTSFTTMKNRTVVAGTTAPGAQVRVVNHPKSPIARADQHGRFMLQLDTSEEGAHRFILQATASGHRPAEVEVTITRTLTREERLSRYASTARSIPYRELARNTEQYVGVRVRYVGEVIQALEEGGRQYLRVNVTPHEFGLWEDTVFVEVADPAAPRILEDDVIEVLGEVRGRFTYTAIFGQKVTLPHIVAHFVRVLR